MKRNNLKLITSLVFVTALIGTALMVLICFVGCNDNESGDDYESSGHYESAYENETIIKYDLNFMKNEKKTDIR